MQDAGVWKGCGSQTKVLVALDEGQENLSGGLPDWIRECYVVNARQIAMESKSRINVVMLGQLQK